MASHIINNISPPRFPDILDQPYWMLETKGAFSVKSTWEFFRRRNDSFHAYNMIWVKGLPSKISFFMWNVWKNKLPLDDFTRSLGYLMASRCWCCAIPEEESVHHSFMKSSAAQKVWSYFLSHARIPIEGLFLHQAIVKCWTAKVIPRLRPIMQAVPSIIVWEL